MTPGTEPRTLYGTEEPPPTRRIVTTGPYRIELVDGRLTHIRFRGREILRGIELVVRDDQWGTLLPMRGEPWEVNDNGGWRYGYEGRARAVSGERLRFRFEARVAGATLTVSVRLIPDHDFTTSRTGLVLLHPLEGTVGNDATVRHSDGTREAGRFPSEISPSQPFFDIAAIRHEPEPGLVVACELDGDVFEMEDQRNWTDASFKTYNRPLAWGSPYTLRAGKTVEQTITVNVSDERPSSPTAADHRRRSTIELALHPGTATAPGLGTGIDVHQLAAGDNAAARLLSGLAPEHLQLLVDLGRPAVAEDLAVAADTLDRAGVEAPLWFGVVAPDDAGPDESLECLSGLLRDTGLAATGVLALPAAYLKSYQPDGEWPAGPGPMAYVDAARAAFPGVNIGGGMLTYFTEVNRCRPDSARIDYLAHSTAAIVHAADDTAVMETLQALPHVFHAGRRLAGNRPYRIGMSAIGMWSNPYGHHTFANEAAKRLPMAWDDPRQRGLFAAAWHLGYYAAAARAGVDALALSSPVAPFPVGRSDALYPVFHVLRGLGRGRASPMLAPDTGGDGRIAATGWSTGDGEAEVWIANLTSQPVAVRATAGELHSVARLEAATADGAAGDPAWLDQPLPHDGGPLHLGAYAVVRGMARLHQA